MELLTGKRFLALRCVLVLGAGLSLGLLLPLPWWVGLIPALLSVVLVILVSKKFLYLLLFFLAVPYASLSLPQPLPDNIYGTNLELEGRLAGKTGDYSMLLLDSPASLKGRKVLIYMTRDEEEGTSLKVQGKLLKLAFPRNPGMPDRNLRLHHEGVMGRISVSYVQTVSPPRRIRAWLNRTRTWLVERNQGLFGREASLYSAVLLGERTRLSDDLYADMRRTGTLHLLAVSGLHVGVLVAFLFFLMRLLHIPRKLILPLLALMLVAYIALVGPRSSIIRASIMSLAVAAGFAFERKVLPLNSLAVAALILLLARPFEILSVGFQLSFAAAFGIIVAAEWVREAFSMTKTKGLGPGRSKRIKIPKAVVRWVLLPLALSLAATLFTMPILAANFHRITFATVLANLPVIPLISLALPLGLVAILLSLVWFPLGKILGWAVFGLCWLVEKLLHYLPGSLIPSATWPAILVAALFLSALILHSEKTKPKRFSYALEILLIGANLAVWPWALESLRPRLTLLDTYHGNVAVLKSDNRILLFNPGSKADPTVSEYLDSRGIRRIDWVLCLSDKDGDLSGLDSLRNRFRIDNIGSIWKDKGPVCIPHSGRLALRSCAVDYDMAMPARPFYSIESHRRRVVFVSESYRIEQDAGINYLLNKYVQPIDNSEYISKEILKTGQSTILREQGGVIIKL